MKKSIVYLLFAAAPALAGDITQEGAARFVSAASRGVAPEQVALPQAQNGKVAGVGLWLPVAGVLREDASFTEGGRAVCRAALDLAQGANARVTLFVPDRQRKAVEQLAQDCPSGVARVVPNAMLDGHAYVVVRDRPERP